MGHRLRSLEFVESIQTTQLHLDKLHMVLEVVVHVGSEFERAVVVANLADQAFSQPVGVADIAEEQGEPRGNGMSRE